MKLKIEISLDNAAFEGFYGTETARILNKLAKRIEYESCRIGDVIQLLDLNGNKVGTAKVSP